MFLNYFSRVLSVAMSEVQIIGESILSLEEVEARIEDLRNRMLAHDDLRRMRTDKAYILRFLHRTHFQVEAAFDAVKNYYRYIVEEFDWLAFEISDRMIDCINMNMRVMLPAVDKYGKKIFYMRTDTMNPSKVTMAEVNQLECVWFESVLDDPQVQEYGLCLLVDVSGFSWKLLKWLTPVNMRRAIRKLENIIVKDATFHVVRCSTFAKIAINMIWPFMPELIKEKFKFHFNDLKPLLDDISRENLLKEYGGSFEVDFELMNRDLLSRRKEINQKLEHYKIISS